MRATFEEYQKVNNSLLMTNLLDFCFFVTDRYHIYAKQNADNVTGNSVVMCLLD